MIQQLVKLRGIGVQSATVLVREAFVREFVSGPMRAFVRRLTAAVARISEQVRPVSSCNQALCPTGLCITQHSLEVSGGLRQTFIQGDRRTPSKHTACERNIGAALQWIILRKWAQNDP
jgi:hypothetical protein